MMVDDGWWWWVVVGGGGGRGVHLRHRSSVTGTAHPREPGPAVPETVSLFLIV